jgi:hypothetical protein
LLNFKKNDGIKRSYFISSLLVILYHLPPCVHFAAKLEIILTFPDSRIQILQI